MKIDNLLNIENIKILVFGDYMVDKYIDGVVNRISPEAPVPIIKVNSKQSKLGGAANTINNVVSLGAKVRAIGCVGKDSDGKFLLKKLENTGIDIKYMEAYGKINTISKTRVVSRNHQFLRLDEEVIEPIPEEYISFVTSNILKIFDDIDALIVSDYGKGSVIEEILCILISEAKKRKIPIIIDPKGKDYKKYNGATVITPNTKELSDVLNKKLSTEEDILSGGIELFEKADISYLALTRSEKGISLFKNGENFKKDFPTVAKDVIDVTGAGDTVVAIFAVLLALKFEIEEVCKIANIAASIVISKFGASTLSLNELISDILKSGEYKLINKETAKYIVSVLKEKGKKVVFTNGTFDLLHSGHLYSFKKAKSFGDILIVAVNSDSSVKKYKGDLRPIINENDRIDMLCSLEIIDYVILMEDDNPSKLIELIKPDIAVKGEDWKEKEIPEKKVIENYGGKLKFIKLYKNKSTTNIINKILEVYGK